VLPLSRLSALALANNISEAFNDYLESDPEKENLAEYGTKIRNCLDTNLEHGVHNDVDGLLWRRLHDKEVSIIDGSPGQANNLSSKYDISQFLPSLFGIQTKCLDFTCCKSKKDKDFMKKLYQVFDTQCPNLEKIVMGQAFFFLPELVSNLNEKLLRLNKLVTLKIMYFAENHMIVNLGKHCPKLLELSVKGSSKIDNASADEIAQCKSLRILDISNTRISGSGCLKIIESCKNLEWLDHCPFNCDADFHIFKSRKEIMDLIKKGFTSVDEASTNEITTGVENIDMDSDLQPLSNANSSLAEINQIEEIEQIQQYSIKNFWLFNPKSELNVSSCCPKIEKFRLDFVFQDMNFELDVSPLRSFKFLDTLDLNFYDNHNNPLLEKILSICGQQLSCLIFNVCAEYWSIVECHNIIARNCRNLTSLTFIGDYESVNQLDQEIDSVLLRRTADWQPHSKLEYLNLGGYCTDGRLAWLLSGCPNIKNIFLDGNLEKLSDSAWLAIMSENKMEHLETLWFNTSTNMTMASIRPIIDECEKLSLVGRLIHLREHSGGARKDQLLDLLMRKKQENWNLDIVWVTPNNIPTIIP